MIDEIKRLKALVNGLQEDDKRHLKALDDLRIRNRSLHDENENLRDSNGILNDENSGLKAKIGFLERKIDPLVIRLDALKREFVPLQEENNRLKDSNRIRAKDNRALERDNNSLTESVNHLRIDLEHSRKLAKSNEKKLQDEKYAAAERKKLYETNLTVVEHERDNNLRAYNTSEENRASLQQAKQVLEGNLTAERARCAALQTAYQSLRGENTTLSANLNGQIQHLRGENNNLQHRNHNLNQQLEGTRQLLNEKEDALEQINLARQGFKRGNTTVRQKANGKYESFRPHLHD
jgi:chromosome segregation ATPase